MIARTFRYVLLGGLLSLLMATGDKPRLAEQAGSPIDMSPARFEQVRAQLSRQLGTDPSAAQLRTALAHEADREVLVRAALDLDWHRTDPVVRKRLAEVMRFAYSVHPAETGTADATLFDAAIALGLHREDPVVRRRLTLRMEHLVTEVNPREAASGIDIEAFYAAHAERLSLPARVTISHVFRSGERAAAELRALIQDGATPDQAAAMSDPFLVPARLERSTEGELEKRLGRSVARVAIQGEPGQWYGPVASVYGMHLVWVHERETARRPDEEFLRTQALIARMESLASEQRVLRMAELRSRYPVRWPVEVQL